MSSGSTNGVKAYEPPLSTLTSTSTSASTSTSSLSSTSSSSSSVPQKIRLRSKEEILQSPSYYDGITTIEEWERRKDACQLLSEAGKKLDIGMTTVATASSYFHQFYHCKSLKDYPEAETVVACLFLACKVSEAFRRLSEIMTACAERQKASKRYVRFGALALLKDSQEWENFLDRVYAVEEILLDVLEYSFHVDKPYKYLIVHLRRVMIEYEKKSEAEFQEATSKKGEIAQFAWFFVNDSLRSTLCLEYPPEIISLGAIMLTFRKHKREVVNPHNPSAKPWHEVGIDLVSCHM